MRCRLSRYGCLLLLLLNLVIAATAGDLQTLEAEVEGLKRALHAVCRQLMMREFYQEEESKSRVGSGIVDLRNTKLGLKSYDTGSFVESSFMGMHNHANNIRTIGLGQFTAVLNGVSFTTRHNDYSLQMKSTSSQDMKATEEVPPPLNLLSPPLLSSFSPSSSSSSSSS